MFLISSFRSGLFAKYKGEITKKRIENKRIIEGFEGATHAQPIQLTILGSD